jgi:predicted transcriptional regulator
MKSATIPSLRVTPEFRHDAENVLREGESLSAFVEESLREEIERRRTQREFIARGLAARNCAKASGQYASKYEVMDSLKSILKTARSKG